MCAHGYTIDCADCWRERCVELEAENAKLREAMTEVLENVPMAVHYRRLLAALQEKVE